MRRRRLLWEFIKIVIFFYAGLMMIWSSSLWHLHRGHDPLPPHDTMVVDLECDGHRVHSKRRCFRRLKQVMDYYKGDACFEKFGLKGNITKCDAVKYLVNVEHECLDISEEVKAMWKPPLEVAKKGEFFGPLYNQLTKCGTICSWLKSRIQNNEKIWSRTYDHVFHHNEVEYTDEEGTVHHKKRYKKRVFMHMGLLKEERGLDFGNGALKGGPLGELNQWADLIAASYVLGHQVVLSWSPGTLEEYVSSAATPPQTCRESHPGDIFYTDVHGIKQLYQLLGNNLSRIKCTLRILDSFGTEPAYNHETYVRAHGLNVGYGQFHLNPQQYFTQWPHTPDNSFMGFVVHRMSNEEAEKVARSQNIALLYGKKEEIIHRDDAKLILNILKDHFEIHATLYKKPTDYEAGPNDEDEEENEISSVPSFIKNHGYVNQSSFLQLLRQSKVYVGLGKPPEGPAALEAIANGAIFLQPKYDPPIDSYSMKPTSRLLTSQNPYMETLGGNFSITYSQYDDDDINVAIEAVKLANITHHVPFPFTHEGFLKRIHAYTAHQDFCTKTTDWPPKEMMKVKLGDPGQSCNDVCEKHSDHRHHRGKDRCEPSWFKHINHIEEMLKLISNCREDTLTTEFITSPYFDIKNKSCFRQKDPVLFSCTGSHPDARRICPCRDTSKQDISLCSTCFVGITHSQHKSQVDSQQSQYLDGHGHGH